MANQLKLILWSMAIVMAAPQLLSDVLSREIWRESMLAAKIGRLPSLIYSSTARILSGWGPIFRPHPPLWSDINDPVLIEPNSLSEPEDMASALAAVELCRELGRSDGFRPLVTGETAPGPRSRSDMMDFIRRSAVTYWYQSCTAKMGRDNMSVVDGELKVYGIEGPRIADSSIMPQITTGNTMAPCVVIGERAADLIGKSHGLKAQSAPDAQTV